MRKIVDPDIAMQKFQFSSDLTMQVSYEKWVEFVDQHLDYFTWLEDTEHGKSTLFNIDKFRKEDQAGVKRQLQKKQACAEFNKKKGYYEVIIDYLENYGKVSTTFMRRITKPQLVLLLAMANYLGAYLLDNGKKILDQKFIDSLP